MLDASSIFYLAMFTLGSAFLIGTWQYRRTKQSLKNEDRNEELFKR